MRKGLIKLRSIITALICVSALALALLLGGGRLFGLKTYVVLSGSMEPAFPTGSIIYVKKTDPYGLKMGDVITFRLDNGSTATHRISRIVQDEGDPSQISFITRGDANMTDDAAAVEAERVMGVPVLTIPKLGYFVNYIQHPPGLYAAAAAAAFLLLIVLLPELTSAVKQEKKGCRKKQRESSDKGSGGTHTVLQRRKR